MRGWRIHITGAPRSGTTLMLALMLTCFEIDGGVAHERRIWRAVPKGKRIVCTKRPGDERISGWLVALDPRLHVICMLRDPRDAVVSVHNASPSMYWSNLHAWRESARAIMRARGKPRLHVVRYDELAINPDAVQARLALEMPFLKPKLPFSQFHEAAQMGDTQWLRAMRSIRAVSAENVGAWKRHLPRLKGQILRHGDISGELITLGFENDKAWLKLLEDVEPDTAPSRTPEVVTFERWVTRLWRETTGTLAYLFRRYLLPG
ncbi:MAG: sulfotransferase family protein [Alphaproteobacteria bacterium]